MRTLFPIIFVLILLLESCSSRRSENVPEALDPDQSSSSYVLKSYRGRDMVESLYKEQLEQSEELSAFEKQLQALEAGRADSLRAFKNYHTNNTEYFKSAVSHVENFQDTVLRDRMLAIIKAAEDRYEAIAARQLSADQLIQNTIVTLSNLHAVLKVTRTLPMIEKYQRSELPDTRAMDGLSRQIDAAIKKANALIDGK